MAARNGPVHAATTRREYKDKVYETHLLRRTYREDGKVKYQTVGNLSHLPPNTIDVIRRSLRGDLPPDGEGVEILRSLPHGHVAAVLGTLVLYDVSSSYHTGTHCSLAKNRVRPRDSASAEFYLLTVPTDVQRRAFDLLGVPIAP